MLESSPDREAIIAHKGHLLIRGGPGSGKTTIAIVKAENLVATLKPGQQVMFLSFARATVARVIEALAEHINGKAEIQKSIEIDTYHAFFWRLLKTHGYLVGLPRHLAILTPPDKAIAMTPIRQNYGSARKLTDDQKAEMRKEEHAELLRLAYAEGKICFDLFSSFVVELVSKSHKLRRLVSTRYPIIILDEFQDTDSGQWAVVQNLGIGSTLIALADEEQRIYDFLGADPERLNHFRQRFAPKEFDFGSANYRSNGTDIARFGNDVLAGKLSSNEYHGIGLVRFPENHNQAMAALKGRTLNTIERLRKAKGKDWALAILVPTKQLMREVSDALRQTQGTMPAIGHHAAIDMEGAILAAELIAFLLQPQQEEDFNEFTHLLCNFFRGKGGDDPSTSDISEASAICRALQKALECAKKGKVVPINSIIKPIRDGYDQCASLKFTGDPDKDWLAVRKVLAECGCKRLAEVAEEARNVRLLDRGTQLRDQLSSNWRENGAYIAALEIVRAAFVQEHFSASMRRESGVIVMNMHKAKGKQFDEVIIFEGWPRRGRGQIVGNPHRIVRGNMEGDNMTHAKYNFRVSVTRARSRTTIMTPENDPCILLVLASRAAKAAQTKDS